MRIFFSEHNKDYSTYTFDYAVYAEMENPSDLPAIYEKGFLPYSNDLSDPREIFYLARSLRVNLDDFEDSSENRRVNRKLESLDLRIQMSTKDQFDLQDPGFRSLCMEYADARFSGNAMTHERFNYVLNRRVLSHIFTFSNKLDVPVGYVFAMIEENTLHYWYSFFDHKLLQRLPIGKWMMWRTIKWARDQGLAFVYLGTCYGEKSLYKVRDFKSLAFFDGNGWNSDMNQLKIWCKTDEETLETDRFKLK